MRTSFHHQPEAQHPIFQLSTSWQADYPIFWAEADVARPPLAYRPVADDPSETLAVHCGNGFGAPIKVLARADTMLAPDLGFGYAAT